MSRIGKKPIEIPKDVTIEYINSVLTITGKFGTLQMTFPKEFNVIIEKKKNGGKVIVNFNKITKTTKSLHGLYRTLIHNMIIGISQQFEITLILKGVGYRASVEKDYLILNLGYSDPIRLVIPEFISVEVAQATIITLKSCNKELLGVFAADVRAWRKPEPYKGKGILYKNEQITRKAGKSGK